MRLTTTARTAAATVAVLCSSAGCTQSSEGPSSAAPSSATTTSNGAAAFCTDAQDAFTDLETAVSATTDPSAIPGLFTEAASRLDAVEAPSEITVAWSTAADAVSQLAMNIQGLDLNTEEDQQAFLDQVSLLQTDAGPALGQIRSYVGANCSNAATPSPSSVAEAVAEAGVSQDLVDRLAQVASSTGYGTSRGTALSEEQAMNFALVQIGTCLRLQAGQTTAVEIIAQDVADGADRAGAETMSAFLLQTFCPAVTG